MLRKFGFGSVLVLSALTFFMTIPTVASAYKTLKEDTGTDGETRWWVIDLPVRYSINSKGSADISNGSEFTAVLNAFSTWEGPACTYLSSEYLGTTEDTVVNGDGKNTFDWVEDKAAWPNEAGPNAIAFTVPMFDGSGRFFEADMRFNGAYFQWSTTGAKSSMDVETIALHELGHVFGLADLYDTTSCYISKIIMCGYNNGETKRALKKDDENGICYLYPTGKEGLCESDTDCSSGKYCVGLQTVYGESGFLCSDPVGNKKPGERCGDVSNTSGNTADDIQCLNGMCLDSQICTKKCSTPADCPYNMGCSEVWTVDEYGGSVKFNGCSTPYGCTKTLDCSPDEVCGLFRAGDAFAKACIKPVGNGHIGDKCSKWDDCQSGICYNGYCSEPCDMPEYCGTDYKCENKKVTGQDGKSDSFFICTNNKVASPDGGVEPIVDSGVPVDDAGTDPDGGSISDSGDQPPPCDCDQTYDCDPDCSCDPECAPPEDQTASKGCSCSSIGL